jgi:hypothetical protein
VLLLLDANGEPDHPKSLNICSRCHTNSNKFFLKKLTCNPRA